nr:hypothetical protein [Tanacetum cinerariifolium]
MDTKYESSDVVEDIEPISMMAMKKPKFELRLPEGFLDPVICDKQQQPMVVVSPVSSTVGENRVRVNEKEKEIVLPSLSTQFWKTGDYESCGNNSETVVPPC